MLYPSSRTEVFARNCVATSQPLAAHAGLEMLRRGGNAADAAVAAAMALTVVEPTSNGIGSDAFALVWSGGGLHGLDASGRSPRLMTRDLYDGEERVPFFGWDGVTTPGAPGAWAALAEKFGTLPLATLAEPAVRYARDGFHVSPEVQYWWARSAERYTGDRFAEWRRIFTVNGGGRAPAVGELFRLPDHARTLEEIAATNAESFYRGRLAEQIDAAARAAHDAGDARAALRAADLAAFEPAWVRPIATDYPCRAGASAAGGYAARVPDGGAIRLHEIPPAGQGITALIALGILREAGFDLADPDRFPRDAAASLHVQIEAMKLAFADAHAHVADPAHMRVRTEDLLDPAYLAQRAARIDPRRATVQPPGDPKPGGTVYLTAADADGNMVSFIQSNYTGFGSGVVVPGTGVALQNRGACFTLEPGHPNELGPNKKPYHTIIPGFLTRVDERGRESAWSSFGVMGGFMQPQGHAQVVHRLCDLGQSPQTALDAPRWQIDRDQKVSIEPGFDAAVHEELRAMGHELELADRRNARFGRGQAIVLLDDDAAGGVAYAAASEPRADGLALGF